MIIKVCFIGLGSIGRRHIRNLSQIFRERKIEYQIDALRSSDKTLPKDIEKLISRQYLDIEKVVNEYDITFITNPTIYHSETIKMMLNKTKHMFIEKPVFDQFFRDIHRLPLKPDSIYYVAAPLRYSPVIQYLKEISLYETIYSVRAISSSYLPEWRDNTDYREIYSAKKEMGGGVTLDLIHEIDYITWLFGMPQKVVHFNGHFSELEINSDDLAVYILCYRDKIAEIHLDYFGRKMIRRIELYCKDYVIMGDLIEHKVSYMTGQSTKEIQIAKQDIYIEEMNAFLDMILENRVNDNSIIYANDILKIAKEQS